MSFAETDAIPEELTVTGKIRKNIRVVTEVLLTSYDKIQDMYVYEGLLNGWNGSVHGPGDEHGHAMGGGGGESEGGSVGGSAGTDPSNESVTLLQIESTP